MYMGLYGPMGPYEPIRTDGQNQKQTGGEAGRWGGGQMAGGRAYERTADGRANGPINKYFIFYNIPSMFFVVGSLVAV